MGVKVRFYRGAWWIFINHRGRRKSKRIGGDRATALRAAKAIRERLVRGDLDLELPQDTLGNYADQWLAVARGNLKASTVSFYEANLDRYIRPALGERPLASLGRDDCRQLIASCRSKGLRTATVRGILRTVSTLLSEAVEDGLLAANPALRLGRYLQAGDDESREIQPLTRDEARTLLATASQHFPLWYPLFLGALRTGMRLGELRALQWPDLDFAGRFLTVRRNLVRGILTTPKSRKRRQVDMSTQLTEVLKSLRRHEHERWLKKGQDAPAWVFASTAGTALDAANIRHLFHRVLRKAGLRRIRFHDLRHTYASLLIQQGESLAYVKEQLGHSSISVTVDVYGHLVPGGNRAAVDRLDDERAHPDASYTHPATDSENLDDGKLLEGNGEPPRTRTGNPQIKSLLLCQLS